MNNEDEHMSVGDHCRRNPLTASPEETVREAARKMHQAKVGTLPIVDEDGRPIGMVTDRDIVQKVLRRRKNPDQIKLGEIASPDVVSVWEDVGLDRALARMRQEGVRRVLVTDDEGKLAGIVAYDDVLPSIANELSLAADVVSAQGPGGALEARGKA